MASESASVLAAWLRRAIATSASVTSAAVEPSSGNGRDIRRSGRYASYSQP